MAEIGEPAYSVSKNGDDITVACEIVVGDVVRRHQVVVNAKSKPTHDAEETFGEMEDARIIAVEEHSFDEWRAGLETRA